MVEEEEGTVRRSIAVRLVRHAESGNNQVYRDAHRLFRSGTPEFDLPGWTAYVDRRRGADPGLSDRGRLQARRLADYMTRHLSHQASDPVRFVVSPMRRTLETIVPTLAGLPTAARVLIHGGYFESEGCHLQEETKPGMNQVEIAQMLPDVPVLRSSLSFEGFPEDPNDGWYSHASGPETRHESEARAAKFYHWLCDHLDHELSSPGDDLFDAGVALEEERHENEHDKLSMRCRKRRTVVLVGHGDFMSLLMKRIVTGFGHAVETHNYPHRSAFAHFNTGITELEYFGAGRFITMTTNHTPHLGHADDVPLIGGGGLRDGGWSYLMPNVYKVCDKELHIVTSNEMDEHVKEQVVALKSLYIHAGAAKRRWAVGMIAETSRSGSELSGADNAESMAKPILSDYKSDVSDVAVRNSNDLCFIVKRGLQVIGCASFNEEKWNMSDVIIRPSETQSNVGVSLFNAVRNHARKFNNDAMHDIRGESCCDNSQVVIERLGFNLAD